LDKALTGYVVSVIDVVMPVLNERRALPWVLGRMPFDFRPIVVDNRSTDGSGDLARALGATVVEESTLGFGSACYAGLVAATSDIVCFMDCDGSLDPADLNVVSEPVIAGKADLVLGTRVPESRSWPLHARAANRLLAAEVRRRTRVRIRDIGPMRAARRRSLLQLDIRDRRFGWPLEMVLRAAHSGWTISEVDVAYRRRAGRSKVTGTVRGTARAVLDMSRVLR
jgi:glycosyltransferase involved in cell wall biosynthesis